MKIVLFSLLCLILVGMTSYSYALEEMEVPTAGSPYVMFQGVVRDSNGILLTYVESDQILLILPSAFDRFLDNLNHTSKEFFIEDDNKYERQQWQTSRESFDSTLAYSSSRILNIYQNEFEPLVILRHDSYQTQPGDTINIFWTVIRLVS